MEPLSVWVRKRLESVVRLEVESRLELRVESVPVNEAVNTAQRPRSHCREVVAVVTRHHSSWGVMSGGRRATRHHCRLHSCVPGAVADATTVADLRRRRHQAPVADGRCQGVRPPFVSTLSRPSSRRHRILEPAGDRATNRVALYAGRCVSVCCFIVAIFVTLSFRLAFPY